MPSANSAHGASVPVGQDRPGDGSPKDRSVWRTQYRFYYYLCVAFFLLEAGFVAFAAFLLRKPLPLPTLYARLPANMIKSLVKSAFLAWHTLAIFIATIVFNHSYSREWFGKPGAPTDSVSTITSGIFDRLQHFGRSTTTFKLTFLGSFSALVLLQLGPTTVNLTDPQQPILVGGLVFGTASIAHSVLKLEQVEDLNLGYNTESNWIIPKPAAKASLPDHGGSVDYTSDVVGFSHTCQWYAPEFSPMRFGEVTINDDVFDFGNYSVSPNSTAPSDESIVGTGVFSVPHLHPTQSTSAFLIFGGNASLPLNPDPFSVNATQPNLSGQHPLGNTIDLSFLPTAYNPSWFNFSASRFTSPDNNRVIFRAPLVTALHCNANAVLKTGRIQLSANNLTVVSSDLQRRRVGNINESDMPPFFSRALDAINDPRERVTTVDPNTAVDPRSDQSPTQPPLLVEFTPLSARLFLPRTTLTWMNASQAPLTADQIAKNIDDFVLSVSKVQRVDAIGGYMDDDLPSSSGPAQILATIRSPQQVLETNPLWFGFTAFSALIAWCLCLVVTRRIQLNDQELPPFELDNIRHLLNTKRLSADE